MMHLFHLIVVFSLNEEEKRAFSELIFPVFPTTSTVAVGLPNTGKYEQDRRIVGDCRV
jgi:hypothetical protein